MILYLVKHGETNHDVESLIQGSLPTALNENGVEQAENVAKELLGKSIHAVIYSPMKRSKQTAEIIEETLNCGSYQENRLADRSFGKLRGKPNKDYVENNKLYWSEKENYSGEELVEPVVKFKERTEEFLKDLKMKNDNRKSFVIVAQEANIAMILRLAGKRKCDYKIKNCEMFKVNI